MEMSAEEKLVFVDVDDVLVLVVRTCKGGEVGRGNLEQSPVRAFPISQMVPPLAYAAMLLNVLVTPIVLIAPSRVVEWTRIRLFSNSVRIYGIDHRILFTCFY